MSGKYETKRKYLALCDKSFKTKLDLFFLSKCVADKGDVQSFQLEEFKKYRITNVAIKMYAAVYWQQKYDYKIGGETIINLYSVIESWKRINKRTLAVWAGDYRCSFSSLLPYGGFERIMKSDRCYYCGISVDDVEELINKQQLFRKYRLKKSSPIEIDRKNPNKEYSTDNVVPCCCWCAGAKADEFTEKEFQTIAAGIRKVWEARLGRPLKRS